MLAVARPAGGRASRASRWPGARPVAVERGGRAGPRVGAAPAPLAAPWRRLLSSTPKPPGEAAAGGGSAGPGSGGGGGEEGPSDTQKTIQVPAAGSSHAAECC
jgi:hypothetical protein